MTEPGWYVDFENRKQRRYHDGNEWTDHFHDPKSGPEPAAPVPPGVRPAGAGDTGPTDSLLTRVLSFAILGLFAGFMFGAFLFNGVGSVSPLTTSPGTVDLIEVDLNAGSSSGAATRTSYVLSGQTSSGEFWRIVDEDAYRVLETEGLPQAVEVGMGDFTDTAERVTGATWQVDHQTNNVRIGWALVLGLIGVLAVIGAIVIAKAKSGGLLAAAVFLIAFAVVGNAIGYKAVQWMQS